MKLQNELKNVYTSSDIRAIKSRQQGWVARITHMGNIRNIYISLVGIFKEKRQLG
jgi:hypothetical protein